MVNNKENNFYAILLFLIWPFVAFLLSFKEYKKSWAKNLVWLFVVFYGFTFVILDEGMDSNVNREIFLNYASADYSLGDFLSTLYSESGKVDVLQDLISFTVSKITDNYHVLFGVFGLIFGFFYSRNIWYLLDRSLPELKKINIILIVCFTIIVAFWQINGFRFWTATHIFIFGILPYLYEKKNKFIWVSLLSVFVHFSFIIPVSILFIYLLLRNRMHIYFYFFLITFFLIEIDISIIRDNLSYMPDLFFDRTVGYLNEEYKSNMVTQRSSYNWLALNYGKPFKWFIFALAVIIYAKGRAIISANIGLLRLFSFALLYFGFANILSNVPSGGRFMSVANLLMVALTVLYIQAEYNLKLIRFVIYISYPAIILFLLFSIRIGFETISLFTVFGNPVLALFGENDYSLINLIK